MNTNMKPDAVTVAIIILINFQIKEHGSEGISLGITTTCGKRQIDRTGLVTHGLSTKEGDWPWHVAIYLHTKLTTEYRCGGTVLNSNSILTAAHCVYVNDRQIVPERLTVNLGQFDLKYPGSFTQVLEVLKLIPHPSYDPSDLSNDIAIIRLSTEAAFNDYVQPICLWDSDKIEQSEVIGKSGTVLGWGVTEKDELSSVLRKAQMPVVSFHTCLRSNRDFFGAVLSDTNFCAGFRNGTSVCNGDSGGSMTFKINGAYHIRGIVSLAKARPDNLYCSTKEYALFTDVAQYLSWIEEVISQRVFQSKHTSESENDKQGDGIFQRFGNVMMGDNCDYYGNDFTMQTSRKEECGEICANNEVCTHFTWLSYDGLGMCLLKNSNDIPSYSENARASCGYKVQKSDQRYNSINFKTSGKIRTGSHCNFGGIDIGKKNSTAEECGEICLQTKNCSHFHWESDIYAGTCRLKGPEPFSELIPLVYGNDSCGFIVFNWNFRKWSLIKDYLINGGWDSSLIF